MKQFYRFFKWGACNHPGNPFYLIMICGFGIACSHDAATNPLLMFFVGAGIATAILGPLYIYTSYSVGKANRRLIDEEEKQSQNKTTERKV
jgi:hypothetical protein